MIYPKAVLWDLDGVLIDTRQQHFESWQIILAGSGITLNQDDFNRTFGMNNHGVLSTLLGKPPDPALLEDIGSRKEALFRQLIRGMVTPLPGVLQWLNQFDAWGLRQAVASSAPMDNITALLEEAGIAVHFTAIVSGSRMIGKPAPDLFLAAAACLGASPATSLVIEDAPVGVEAAKKAGMHCLAVRTTHTGSGLDQADLILSDLTGLTISDAQRLLKIN
ncbi:MAG TPA: HAD family phosphatase [Anaerolineaceae bacterium]